MTAVGMVYNPVPEDKARWARPQGRAPRFQARYVAGLGGQASLGERVGVWSLYRQGDPEAEFTTCLRRTLKTAVHETGHMFGIAHCTAYECGMNGSNHRAEADSRPLWFCPEDEMKVWWACRVDPAARYDRLSQFADEHGLAPEARFWRASRAALAGRPR